MLGYIYFAINESMPNLIKVGYSQENPLKRLNQLYSTGVPEPFQPVASFFVKNPKECEEKIHQKLNQFRKNDQREFFEINVSQAVKISTGIIISFMPSDYSKTISELKAFTLDDEQTFVLKLLLEKHHKNHGMSTETMTNYGGHWANPLKLEPKLIQLKTEGLVEELKQRKGYPSLWRITSLGVEFMFNNNLVEVYHISSYEEN